MKKKRKRLYYTLFGVLSLLFSLSGTMAFGQRKDAARDYAIDSTLYAYYRVCMQEIGNPAVMQMADTLFLMAKGKADPRMQAVALCTKVDYHYFRNRETDSILHYAQIVMDFARETRQPKYYYFIWAKRLITHHLKNQRYALAVSEAQRLVEESNRDGYPEGISNGYNIISEIYAQRFMMGRAIQAKEQEISINEKYGINQSNLSNAYSILGYLYARTGAYGKADDMFRKANQHLYTDSDEYYICVYGAYNLIRKKQFGVAWNMLERTRKLIEESPKLQQMSYAERQYQQTLCDYYIATGNHEEALKLLESRHESGNRHHAMRHYLDLARIYTKTGNLPKAIESYELYEAANDSLLAQREDEMTAEYAMQLNVYQLNQEKAQLEAEAYKADARNRMFAIILLSVILTLVIIAICREHRHNKYLRSSRRSLAAVNEQLEMTNRQLENANKELHTAKKLAENASRMKTEFIQNMNHEIRTPLNSIIGFSQLLVDMIDEENEEANEYAAIIERGSRNLLKLIDDIINLSNLDSGTEITCDKPVGATDVCRNAFVQVEKLVKPGVTVQLKPECQEEFFFFSNPQHIHQVLVQLLNNAAKFTETGSIVLGWQRHQADVFISFTVTDTGCGIPADKHQFVFERFAKIDTFALGNGLGLPIARICAERINGTLTIDPAYTGGCRFILTIPIKHQSE